MPLDYVLTHGIIYNNELFSSTIMELLYIRITELLCFTITELLDFAILELHYIINRLQNSNMLS